MPTEWGRGLNALSVLLIRIDRLATTQIDRRRVDRPVVVSHLLTGAARLLDRPARQAGMSGILPPGYTLHVYPLLAEAMKFLVIQLITRWDVAILIAPQRCNSPPETTP